MAIAAATQTISEPAWVKNIKLLQEKVYSIVGKVSDPGHTVALLDEYALKNYWAKCFTHKSVDPTNNYDTMEFYGDKVMNFVFSAYIRKRFEDKLDQAKGTLILNQYMSKPFQAELAERLGLPEYIRYDPACPNVNTSVKEDVLEAFFGCLNNLVDDRIQEGMGSIYCRNLITEIFNTVPISPEDIQKDPKTRLKELFEKLGWGEPSYVTKNSDDPRQGEYRVDIRNRTTGALLGTGYGSSKKAEAQAAENALNKLAEEGVTLEFADKEKLERQRVRNPAFDQQYRRVEMAIEKLNAKAKAQGKVHISNFKISPVESHKVPGGFRYTFAIDVAFEGPDGKLQWRKTQQYTGDDSDQTKIEVMKRFADQNEVPAQV